MRCGTSGAGIDGVIKRIHSIDYRSLRPYTIVTYSLHKDLDLSSENKNQTALIKLAILLPNISFLRRFFASSVNPAAMSAAKTKAQSIIDENAVGRLDLPQHISITHAE